MFCRLFCLTYADKYFPEEKVSAIQGNWTYGFHHEALHSDSIITDNVSWIRDGSIPDTFECTAKFRYRQLDNKVTAQRLNDIEVKVIFHEPIRAIASGQAVVFYQGEECLGRRNY